MGEKAYLINIALLLYLNASSTPNDIETLIQFLSQEENLDVMQIVNPFILRYLCACLFIKNPVQRTQSFSLKDLVHILADGQCNYSDALTRFTVLIYEEFDFYAAREELKNLEQEFSEDYFLKDFTKKIVENARIVYFDTYCKIYNAVDLKYPF